MRRNYFEYPTPFREELQEKFVTPYRFSQELQDYVVYMFQHPVHSKHRQLFIDNMRPTDPNDMLKPVYLLIKEFQSSPQKYGHELNNIVPAMLVMMWKAFKSLHMGKRKLVLTKYHPTSMKTLVLAENKFLDIFLEDIRTGNFIGSNDEMVKERTNLPKVMLSNGKGSSDALRGRIGLGTQEGRSKTHFEYLCKLGEEYN